MPITAGDLLWKLSTKSGSAGNSQAQADVNQSLGKYVSTTQVSGTSLNNIFDNISGSENAASTVDYRCIFIHNNHGSLTLQSAVVWISSEVSGGASVAIGLDPAGNVAVGSASPQAAEIATELNAPAGVSFSAPTSQGSGLSIGNLAAGQVRAIWIRRTAANTSALDNDGFTLGLAGDTAQ